MTRAAAKRLEELPTRDFARLDAKITALADDPRPHGAEKLEGVGEL